MYPTTSSKAFLPHEVNQIDQIFQDVLRERGLTRNCEAAEAIARRLMDYYQGGVRESGALKYMLRFVKKSPAENADFVNHGSREVSMQEIAGGPNRQISPDELDMLQRTFDRVCIWCSIPRYGKRADRLARHITAQFRNGVSDEAALFETAMWLEQNSDGSRYRPDA